MRPRTPVRSRQPGYASITRRGMALAIDVTVLGLIKFGIQLLLWGCGQIGLLPEFWTLQPDSWGTGMTVWVFWDITIPGPSTMATMMALGVGLVYFSWCEGSVYQATIGKLLVGLRVAGCHGDSLSPGRAALRTLAKALSALPLGLGFLLPLVTPRRQALHDLLSGAVVLAPAQRSPRRL